MIPLMKRKKITMTVQLIFLKKIQIQPKKLTNYAEHVNTSNTT